MKQVGRELGVRYVLEGSVRRGGQRVRVNAQLIDAETGNHVWAERYDRDLADVFAVQDEITLAVTRAIGPAVADAEQRRALRKPPAILAPGKLINGGFGISGGADRRMFRWPVNSSTVPSNSTRCSPPPIRDWRCVFNREGAVFASRPLLEALRLSGDEAQKALELDPDRCRRTRVSSVRRRASWGLCGWLRSRRAGAIDQPELRHGVPREGLAT